VVAINALVRYLPVFVQQRTIDIGLMHFLLAFVSLAVVVATLFVIRSLRPDHQSPGRGD
jgi:hypothetical protein